METYRCSTCPMRAKHDAKPTSFTGRFWRWHINFCPGWKAYFNSLSDVEKEEIGKRNAVIGESLVAAADYCRRADCFLSDVP